MGLNCQNTLGILTGNLRIDSNWVKVAQSADEFFSSFVCPLSSSNERAEKSFEGRLLLTPWNISIERSTSISRLWRIILPSPTLLPHTKSHKQHTVLNHEDVKVRFSSFLLWYKHGLLSYTLLYLVCSNVIVPITISRSSYFLFFWFIFSNSFF